MLLQFNSAVMGLQDSADGTSCSPHAAVAPSETLRTTHRNCHGANASTAEELGSKRAHTPKANLWTDVHSTKQAQASLSCTVDDANS